MNPDARRFFNHIETYGEFDTYRASPPDERPWQRIAHPAALICALVFALTICYQAASQNGHLQALPVYVWDGLVHITPARLLFAIDSWLNPSLFPAPMLQTQTHTHAAKSEVLRRVLGMDKPGGIMEFVSMAGRRSLTGLAGAGSAAKGDSERPPGLGNWDNSCYQNSILQSLSALKPLPAYLAGFAEECALNMPDTSTVDTLRQLVKDLNDTSNNGSTLWTPGILKSMSTWQQQDAQEYFSKLLDEMDKEIAGATKAMQKPAGFDFDFAGDETARSQHSEDSGYQSLSTHSKSSTDARATRSPLEGLAAQRVACTACGYSEGLSMIPFNCLTLSLGTDRSEHTLYDRLDSYTKVESIPGVYCPKCTLLKYGDMIEIIIERSKKAGNEEKDFPEPFARLRAIEAALEEDRFDDETLSEECKILPQQRVNSTKTKQAVIARAPQSLVVHVNRSVFDELTGNMFKNSAAVRFPMTLDLGPWCLGSADRPTGHDSAPETGSCVGEESGVASEDKEQWLLDPRASMVAGGEHPSKITGPIYKLRAVITHHGRHENGHYVCYRKHPGPHHREQRPPQLGSAYADHAAEDGMYDETSGTPGPDTRSKPEEVRGTKGAEPASRWWRLSDQDVSPADEGTVLAQGGVFMLFYDCVDPNSVMISDAEAAPARAGAPGPAAPPTTGVAAARSEDGIAAGSPVQGPEPSLRREAAAGGPDCVLRMASREPLPG